MSIETPLYEPESNRNFGSQIAAMFESEIVNTRRTQQLDEHSFQVLTVCAGNICRSPLTQMLIAEQLRSLVTTLGMSDDFWHVSSSGLGAMVGAGVDPEVRKARSDLGNLRRNESCSRITRGLTQHRARQFEPQQAEAAHLVLTATRRQRDALIAQTPSAAGRAFTLAEFARLLETYAFFIHPANSTLLFADPADISRSLQSLVQKMHLARAGAQSPASDDVEDPHGKDRETHRRVADRISALCASIGERLRCALA